MRHKSKIIIMIFIIIIIIGQILIIENRKSNGSFTESEKEWEIEALNFKWSEYFSPILDSKGNPHLILMENNTFYLKKNVKDSLETEIEGFEIGDNIRSFSIIFDVKDNLHLCYFEWNEKKNKICKI